MAVTNTSDVAEAKAPAHPDAGATPRPQTATPAPPAAAPRHRMVGWYDPRQLARIGVEVAISSVFGRHSDFRTIEALSSGKFEIYDYTFHYTDDGHDVCEPDQKRPRQEMWLDYVGDVGDGWNSTYAVAYQLAQAEGVVPDDPKATAPELIEPPIVLEAAPTRTGVAAGDASPSPADCGPTGPSGNGSK